MLRDTAMRTDHGGNPMKPRQQTQNQQPTTHGSAILIRPGTGADSPALERLAQLDSASPLAGDVLVAERAGEPVAAITVETGSAIADPFQLTADIVAMLAVRRQHLVEAPTATQWWRLGFGSRRADDPSGLVGVRI